MNLTPVCFEQETTLQYHFALETTGLNRFYFTLVAAFSGNYREGSAGKPDANFICGIALTALRIWKPAALILDLRELSYTWGDDMAMVLDAGEEEHVPTAVVGSTLCLPAIGTLIHGANSNKPATDAVGIFDDIQKAWEYVRKRS